MPLDARTYLFDIITAIEAAERFTERETFESYAANEMLVSAVERQCSIIGEAVTQLLKLEPDAAISNARQIIGFRNILIHNYARVSQAVVWTTVKEHLPRLQAEARDLLDNLEADGEGTEQ